VEVSRSRMSIAEGRVLELSYSPKVPINMCQV
jgi:hypothetical protein